jgi:peptide/nickel transport system permease protein
MVVEPPRTASMRRDRSRAASRMALFLRRLLSHRSFLIGATLFSIIVLTALLAPSSRPTSPTGTISATCWRRPRPSTGWAPTAYGRDVLSRVIYGTRVSLRIGLSVVLLTGIFGRRSGCWPAMCAVSTTS